MKNIKLRGNKEKNAAACWSKHKTNYSGLEKGNVRGRNKNFYQYPRVQSPWERKRFPPGWKVGACVSVGVSVDEIKVSLLLRGLIIIMTVQNDTFNLCLGTKLAMTSVALLLVLLSVFFFSLLPWYCLFCFAMVVKLPSSWIFVISS